MVFHVGDHFRKFFDVWRLQVNEIKGKYIIFEGPEVDTEVIGREEVLAVGGYTHTVDVVVVAILELLLLNRFVPLVHGLGRWQYDLAVLTNVTLISFAVYFVFEFPELDYAIIRR